MRRCQQNSYISSLEAVSSATHGVEHKATQPQCATDSPSPALTICHSHALVAARFSHVSGRGSRTHRLGHGHSPLQSPSAPLAVASELQVPDVLLCDTGGDDVQELSSARSCGAQPNATAFDASQKAGKTRTLDPSLPMQTTGIMCMLAKTGTHTFGWQKRLTSIPAKSHAARAARAWMTKRCHRKPSGRFKR